MFDSDVFLVPRVRTVRVPMAALSSRPHGIAVAAAVVDLGGDDPRTLEQIRADVLADLSWSALHAGYLGCCNPTCGNIQQPMGERRGRAVHVGVTVPITTLLGVDDHPAHLHSYGPITVQVARRLAADGIWRRLLTNPRSGALLDYGTTRYAHRLTSPTSSWPGTGRAGSPPARGRPTVAMPTTPSPPMPAGPRCGQPRAAAPSAPRRQDPPRLATPPARTRPIHLASPHRPHL
jgi:hypothetical protein